jgi:hypothetical protein
MAISDLTTWTESDPQNRLTVTATSVTINDLERDDDGTYVYYDFGAGYWSGDWEIRFKYTTPASGESDASSWIYPVAFTNDLNEQDGIEALSHNSQGVLFLNSAGTPRFPVYRVETGARTTEYPTDLAWETTYYITLARDDDGGGSGKGQLTLRIYTVNYYGEDGAVEHDTVTLDLTAQVDFQYILLASPRGNDTQATDGLIEDLDLDLGAANYVDIAGTISASTAVSGSLDVATAASIAGTISGVSSVSGVLTVSNFPSGSTTATNSKLSVMAFGNNRLYYEDV